MRKLPLLALALAAGTLAACSDSSTGTQIYRVTGTLDADGMASVVLPREVGTVNNLPALTCYTAQRPGTGPSELDNVWFLVGSVELPQDYFPGIPQEDRVLDNCILEPVELGSQQLKATIEGQPPNWLYAFTVIY